MLSIDRNGYVNLSQLCWLRLTSVFATIDRVTALMYNMTNSSGDSGSCPNAKNLQKTKE